MKLLTLLKKKTSKLKENVDEYFNRKSINGQSHMAKWSDHSASGAFTLDTIRHHYSPARMTQNYLRNKCGAP